MSKPDAERAMDIYRLFTKQTDFVVQYLSVARQWEHHTRVEVPKLKHAPVNLGRQLEDYLKDADFEIHRRQYLAELDAKKKGGSSAAAGASKSSSGTNAATSKSFPSTNGSSSAPAARRTPVTRGPEPDLIDFFESIEQNQTPMDFQVNPQHAHVQAQAPSQLQLPPGQQLGQTNTPGNPWPSNGAFPTQQQQRPGQQFPQGNGFVPQQTGFQGNTPFQQQNLGAFSQQPQIPNPVQPSFTGAGFGGFTPQQSFTPGTLPPIPQNPVASFQTGTLSPPMQTGLQPGQQITNPFRASMMMANPTGMNNNTFSTHANPQMQQQTGLSRQSTNPFARSSPQAVTPFSNPPSSSSANSPFQTQQQQQPAMTGPSFQPQTTSLSQGGGPLQPMQTGTNPFAKNFASGQNTQQRPQTSAGLMAQPTGSTNPFRQGAFVNHQTGMGWQHGQQQQLGGGLDQLETVPVFPRPAQQTPWQQ